MSKVPTSKHLHVRLPGGLTTAELEPVLCRYVRFLLKRQLPDHRVSVEVAKGGDGSMTLGRGRTVPPDLEQALSFAISVWEAVFAPEAEGPMARERGLDCLCGGDHEMPPLPEDDLGHDLETWRRGDTDEGEARQASPLEG